MKCRVVFTVVIGFGLLCIPFVIWWLFELQRMPYRPPVDMSTLLGRGEIAFVRGLIVMFAAIWVGCAVAFPFALRQRRARPGQCPTCGYDLRGQVADSKNQIVCPECG